MFPVSIGTFPFSSASHLPIFSVQNPTTKVKQRLITSIMKINKVMQFTKVKLSYSDFISKVINPGLIFIQKATLLFLFLGELSFGGACY